MGRRLWSLVWIACLAALVAGEATEPVAPACASVTTACLPTSRPDSELMGWRDYHDEFIAEADRRREQIEVLFIGDSITEALRLGSRFQSKVEADHAWRNEHYYPDRAGVFAISGDQTGHVLWRLLSGELDRLQPYVVVLNIGTNNLARNRYTAEHTYLGIEAIVAVIRAKLPRVKIIIMKIFPRGRRTATEPRELMKEQEEVNDRVEAKWANKEEDPNRKMWTVAQRAATSEWVLDCNEKFQTRLGVVKPTLMPDYLHLNRYGHLYWGDCIRDEVNIYLKACTTPENACRDPAVTKELRTLPRDPRNKGKGGQR